MSAAIVSAAPSAFAVDAISGDAKTVASSTQSTSGVTSFGDAVAKPGQLTTFYRDTQWQLAVPTGSTVRATAGGGIEFVDASGAVTGAYAPAPMADASGVTHQITWTIEGTTLRQHVDITTASVQGSLRPEHHVQPRGFWDCVTKTGKGGMAGGLVTGCVAGAETGCLPGAAVGGFAGGLGGIATGIFTC
ncbi:hypothetical protein ACWCXH_36445 [Kitasatospora sp. NPDC001660]